MNLDNTIRPRLHPEFPGPIGAPKAGRQARMSYVDGDGKRQWHVHAITTIGGSAQHIASLTGESLKSVMGTK